MSGSPSSVEFARSRSQLRSLETTGQIRYLHAFVELGPLEGATQARFVQVEVVRGDDLIRVRWPVGAATADLARLTRRLRR